MSDRDMFPAPYRFFLSYPQWQALHDLHQRLPLPEQPELQAILDAAQEATLDKFAVVVWSRFDIHNAIARYRDVPGVDYGEETTLEQAGVTEDVVDDILVAAESTMGDQMVVCGWEVLDEVVALELE